MHQNAAASAGTPPARLGLQVGKNTVSWTDDLPVCHLSGVGFATNQMYREDGFRIEEHEFEDRSIHFSLEEGMYLYGIFDGHDGSRVSNFAAQRMPAEILLGQLGGTTDDKDVKEVLRQAFVSVEKGYFDSIDDLLAQKANLQLQIPEGVNFENMYPEYQEVFKQLQSVDAKLSGGATAVVGLVFNNKLFVANVGCARALFCNRDAAGHLRVFQVSTDHNLDNQEELRRLAEVGIDVGKLKEIGKIGNHNYTRTIGDYHIKGNYKETQILSSASADPLIADPEVCDAFDLTEASGFLILMSYGLFKSLKDATLSEHVNADIASMVAAAFNEQTTLNGVAQAVVDKVVRIHHDTYMTCSGERKNICQTRKDITLLVRNFNYPLPNAVSSPTTPKCGIVQDTLIPQQGGTVTKLDQPLSLLIPNKSPPDVNRALFIYTNPSTCTNSGTYKSTIPTNTYSSNDSNQSSDGASMFSRSSRGSNPLQLDADGRIESYVDFTAFFETIDALSSEEKEKYLIGTELKPAYEPIMEESNDEEQSANESALTSEA